MPQAMIMPKKYFFDSNGDPLVYGKIYTYEAGTTNNKVTYTTEDGDVANPNPVILNGEGYASIYLEGSYNIVVDDQNDVNVWSEDPVSDPAEMGEPWINELAITYVGPSEFKVAGNKTDLYQVGRALKIEDSTTIYGYVEAVSFVSEETFVIVDSGTVLTPSASKAWVGVVVIKSIPNGGLAVAGSKINGFDSVANLHLLTGNSDGIQISIKGYLPDSSVGGGILYWDDNGAKSEHDGIRIFSPTVPFVASEDYYNAVGETDPSGDGVWRKLTKYLKDKLIEAQIERINSLIASGELIWSVLGDSTEAGVGAGGGAYAQCSEERLNGWANYVAYQMIVNAPAFIGLDENSYQIVQAFSANSSEVLAPIALPYPAWQGTKGVDPSIEFFASNAARNSRTDFTVYINERTNDAAAIFRMTVRKASDSTLLYQGNIDTYVAQETFGAAGSFNVSGRLAKRTVTLSAGERYVKVTLDQFDTVDRGSGPAADGTAAIYGFTFGDGVEFHNLSVSSTTLKNSSSANITRGITTTGRLTAAQAFNTNMFVIGFGTNDSKTGVSTEGDFRLEYKQLVEDILTGEPDAIIILSTDPRGAGGSAYQYNPAYNAIVRDIADEYGFILFDVEKLSDTLPSGFYADDVHPSSEGVFQLISAFSSLISIEERNLTYIKPSAAFNTVAGEFEIADATAIPITQTEIFSEIIPRNNKATFLIVTAEITFEDPTNSNINATAYLKLNGFTVDQKRVATLDASGSARQQIAMKVTYQFGTSDEYDISVEVIDNTGNNTTRVNERAVVSYLWV